jgi:hypothetical protein
MKMTINNGELTMYGTPEKLLICMEILLDKPYKLCLSDKGNWQTLNSKVTITKKEMQKLMDFKWKK